MKLRTVLAIFAITFIPTLLIWFPFIVRAQSIWGIPLPQNGMATIVANYDGPLYMVVAKTFYNASQIEHSFSFNLPVIYYAAHFPFFPFLIRIFSLILVMPYAMLVVSLLSSFICLFFFYKFIRDYVSNQDALFLTFAFSVFPARFLIVRSVGSPEPLFVGAIIASIYYFKRKNYLLASIWGVVAQITKSPAILLFVSYLLAIGLPAGKRLIISNFGKTVSRLNFLFILVLLIPLSLVGVFFLYKFSLGDFFSYFHSGDNIHLFFPPFEIFNYAQPWVNTHWLEEIIFVYLLGFLGIATLWKEKDKTLFWFVAVFFFSTIFVSHRDLIRYSLPIVPFLYAAFSKYLVKREFKLAILFLLVPIYLFSLAFISNNVMPISDWAPFL
ncbi:hypothetical protein HYS03_01640 [Candidatus Woesebacteria bacterium]|nr:hypothetical protein [Candidatus Woesebacteria bacterium]QQG47021.1 MAG: hypothetical protein HY044_02680 [Candidatus Woesebacteria bacterium]